MEKCLGAARQHNGPIGSQEESMSWPKTAIPENSMSAIPYGDLLAIDDARGETLVLQRVLCERLIPLLAQVEQRREQEDRARSLQLAAESKQDRQASSIPESTSRSLTDIEKEELLNAYTATAQQLDALWKCFAGSVTRNSAGEKEQNEGFWQRLSSQSVVPCKVPPTNGVPFQYLLNPTVSAEDCPEISYVERSNLGQEIADILSPGDLAELQGICRDHCQRVADIVRSSTELTYDTSAAENLLQKQQAQKQRLLQWARAAAEGPNTIK